MPRRLYIETVGCQMNVLDSELVAAGLLERGYELVDDRREADTILFNTCSVRQHAEDKVYSALGRLKHIKEQRPGTIIGVMGCMAQKDRDTILRRAPHVDLVVGSGQLGRLPELLEEVSAGSFEPRVEVSLDRTAGDRQTVMASFEPYDPGRTEKMRSHAHQAMVRIMLGCDQFCTYCIVPGVRGPEQSRSAAEIEAEVHRLADEGCVEVTLLGQAVNRYRDTTTQPETRLAALLANLHDIEGIRRLKFVTNHPRHMSRELIEAVRDLQKVSPYFHVPAQSGSDTMLGRMNRGYTSGEYRDMLAMIRDAVPDAAVTSDFIVGFCGEMEEDFQQTMELVREARFKNSFIFKYSQRPGTKAADRYEDDVPYAVKQRRNNELLDVQNAISLEDNRAMVGGEVEILVEGPSKAQKKRGPAGQGPGQLVGRTVCDRIVVFDGPRELTGRILPVTIDKAEATTLFGSLRSQEPGIRGRESGVRSQEPGG